MRSLFKMHGGKYYLKDFVISNFPINYENLNYVEPYAGAANILINKKKSIFEALSDINNNIISIWVYLKENYIDFYNKLKELEYSQETFDKALNNYYPIFINEFVLRRMSRGGLGKNFAWSNRQRGGKPGDINAWETSLELIPILYKRIKDVIILNINSIDLIKGCNCKNYLLYLDPPYLTSTRVSKKTYDKFECDENHHVLLGDILNNHKAKIMISGYNSDLYKKIYKNWNMKIKKIPNHSSQQKNKKIMQECIWFNY